MSDLHERVASRLGCSITHQDGVWYVVYNHTGNRLGYQPMPNFFSGDEASELEADLRREIAAARAHRAKWGI